MPGNSSEKPSPRLQTGSGDPGLKRRKIRKGTHSCWECKRLKTRCIFSSPSDTVCRVCRRRKTKCVSQDYDYDQAYQRRPDSKEGVLELSDSSRHSQADAYPSEVSAENGDHQPRVGLPLEQGSRLTGHLGESQHRVSRGLLAALPSQEQVRRIFSAAALPRAVFRRILLQPSDDAENEQDMSFDAQAVLPDHTAHPILIAHKMLLIAIVMQYLHSDVAEKVLSIYDIGVRAREIADAAIQLISISNDLDKYAEGLQCLILEAVYHCNCGSLQKSCLAIRRSMTMVQLMGVDRGKGLLVQKLDSNTCIHPRYILHRLLYAERLTCLMLGISPCSYDCDEDRSALSAADRLEREHSHLVKRILERNSRRDPEEGRVLTRAIDCDLRKAADAMPPAWWLPPVLGHVDGDSTTIFSETSRLVSQASHYTILNMVHLPHMLRSSDPDVEKPKSGDESHSYSRLACLTASREVLSRFLAYRSFNPLLSQSYRCIDFFALMAAMTLLSAHITSRLRQQTHFPGTTTQDPLIHSRPADRAMVEKVVNSMEIIHLRSGDSLSKQSGEVLRRLMLIEGAAIGEDSSQNRRNRDSLSLGFHQPDEANAVQAFGAPYFGTDVLGDMAIEGARLNFDDELAEPRVNLPWLAGTSPLAQSVGLSPIAAAGHQPTSEQRAEVSYHPSPLAHQIETLPGITDGAYLQSDFYHEELLGSGDLWAIQGLDRTFFDALMQWQE